MEVKGTAKREPFDEKELLILLNLAKKGINELIAVQKDTLKNIL